MSVTPSEENGAMAAATSGGYERALRCRRCGHFLLPHDRDGHERWHANRCSGCHHPVNMALEGGVSDEHGRPFHDCCLRIKRAADAGDPAAQALVGLLS